MLAHWWSPLTQLTVLFRFIVIDIIIIVVFRITVGVVKLFAKFRRILDRTCIIDALIGRNIECIWWRTTDTRARRCCMHHFWLRQRVTSSLNILFFRLQSGRVLRTNHRNIIAGLVALKPGTIRNHNASYRARISIVEFIQLVHDRHMLRIDLLIRFIQPQHRRANQMGQPMQIARNKMLIAEPCAKNIVWTIDYATSQMWIACQK